MRNRHRDVGKTGAVHIGQVDTRCGAQAHGLATFGEGASKIGRSSGSVQVQRGRIVGAPDGDGQRGGINPALSRVAKRPVLHLVSKALRQSLASPKTLHFGQCIGQGIAVSARARDGQHTVLAVDDRIGANGRESTGTGASCITHNQGIGTRRGGIGMITCTDTCSAQDIASCGHGRCAATGLHHRIGIIQGIGIV